MTTPAVATFNWLALGRYKTSGRFPDTYPPNIRTFYSPDDGPGIHALLLAIIQSAQQSIVLNMYGFDDQELDNALLDHSANPRVYLQMSLDKTQAGGRAEKDLLAKWQNGAIGTSIAIGTSRKHASITSR